MAESGSNAILSEDEIEAALSEIESMPGGMDDIPSLDDDLSDDTTPSAAPAPRPQKREPAKRPASPPPAAPATATEAAAPETGAFEPGLDDETAVATAEADPEAELRPAADRFGWLTKLKTAVLAPLRRITARKGEKPSFAPESGWLPMLSRGVDMALDIVNRPFTWMNQETRHVVGLIGLMTLVFSVLVLLIGPMLAPESSAVEFIKQKRAELIMLPPEDAGLEKQP